MIFFLRISAIFGDVPYSDSAVFVTFSLYVVLVCKKLLPFVLFIYYLRLSALGDAFYTLSIYFFYILQLISIVIMYPISSGST
jgi:hypothetical protein